MIDDTQDAARLEHILDGSQHGLRGGGVAIVQIVEIKRRQRKIHRAGLDTQAVKALIHALHIWQTISGQALLHAGFGITHAQGGRAVLHQYCAIGTHGVRQDFGIPTC